MGEVLGWLRDVGFEFVHAIPKTTPFTELAESERLFKAERVGTRLERLLVNLGMVLTGHREGGFFIIIAKRPEIASTPPLSRTELSREVGGANLQVP